MEITYKKPAELTPYENNTKVHPPEQIDRIAESIKRFGFQQPIVVDRDNVVIIGHGRLLAAKQLLLDAVPVVCADELTEEQAQALRLADNKTNESPWDFGKLEEELAALSIAGVDMTVFGFDDAMEKEIPGNLDNEEEYKTGISCKLSFDNYEHYKKNEKQIKQLAEEMGAKFALITT